MMQNVFSNKGKFISKIKLHKCIAEWRTMLQYKSRILAAESNIVSREFFFLTPKSVDLKPQGSSDQDTFQEKKYKIEEKRKLVKSSLKFLMFRVGIYEV